MGPDSSLSLSESTLSPRRSNTVAAESQQRRRIAITLGDPNGIGPEVVLKCLDDPLLKKRVEPVLVGSIKILEFHAKLLGMRLPPIVEGLNKPISKFGIRIVDTTTPQQDPLIELGRVTPWAGSMAMNAVDEGIRLAMQNQVDALVTAPISKLAIVQAGFNFPGHTEYLAKMTKVKQKVMMMVSDQMRISLVTDHIAVGQISERITAKGLMAKLQRVRASLMKDFRILHPKIAVLGLNPHAGEGGVLGNEEKDMIIPAIKEAGNRGILAFGPFPADAFFGNRLYCAYDAIMAMYHDQGLIPFKTLSFGRGVNFTAGLPIVRTSPDHGTAFDIAGSNKANEGSMVHAVLLAALIAENRQ